MTKESLRASTTIPVAPTTLYLAWLNSEQHGAMTGGGTAKIDPTVGGKFTALDGYITGKLIALDLGRRILMSWRTADFPRDASDSRVEIHLEALGGSTRVTVLHTEIPEGQGERYRETWNDAYFHSMRTYFSKYLPDPRKPPPPRRPPPPPEADEEIRPSRPKLKAKPLPPVNVKAKPAPKKPAPSKPVAAKPAKKAAKAAPKKAPAKPPAKKTAPKKPAAKKFVAKKPVAKKLAKKPAPKPAKKAVKKPAPKKKAGAAKPKPKPKKRR